MTPTCCHKSVGHVRPIFSWLFEPCSLVVNSVQVELLSQQPRGGDLKCPKEFCPEFPDKKPATPFRKPCQVISRSAASEALSYQLAFLEVVPIPSPVSETSNFCRGRPACLPALWAHSQVRPYQVCVTCLNAKYSDSFESAFL